MPKTKSKCKLRVERDQGFLLTAPEVSIFLACLSAVSDLRGLAVAYECGELNRIVFTRRSSVVLGELSELVAATERFDIVWPLRDFGRFSPFFWRWYNWWNDYLEELTPRQISLVERSAHRQGPVPSGHRPKEHWVSYRRTPAFALVIT